MPSRNSASTRTKVLLLGDGPTALTALRSLIDCCSVLGVLRGEGYDPTQDPVRACAAEHGVEIWTLGGARELPEFIGKLRPDVVVISSFKRILSADVLGMARFINVHYSPLPQYRGRANVNWAIINGEPTAAISIHHVAAGLDDGNILFQEEIPIMAADTVESLYQRLNAIQQRELGPAVARAAAGDPGATQVEGQATYGCARTPEDGEIDWSKSCCEIDRLIRGLSAPFLLGAFTHLERRRLVIARAAPAPDAPLYKGRVPGRIVGRSANAGWVDVLTGDGILRILEVGVDFWRACPRGVGHPLDPRHFGVVTSRSPAVH